MVIWLIMYIAYTLRIRFQSDVASTFSNLATTPAEQAPIFPSQNIIERG